MSELSSDSANVGMENESSASTDGGQRDVDMDGGKAAKVSRKKSFKPIYFFAREAALHFGVAERTLSDKLRTLPSADGKWSIRQVFEVLTDSSRFQAAELKIKEETAREKELANRQTERELITLAEAENFIRDNFAPRREFMVSQAGRLAALINPADPAHARAILDKDCDQYLTFKQTYPARGTGNPTD